MMARQEAAIQDSIRLAEEQQQAAEEQAQALLPEMEMDSATAAAHEYQLIRDKFGAFASASAGEEQLWTLENQLQRITLSSKGGYIKQVELKDYRTYDSLPLINFDPETAVFDLSFFANNRIINTSQLYFQPFVNGEPYQGGDLFTNGDSIVFTLRAYADDINGLRDENKYLEYVYTLRDDNYMLDFDLRTVGLNDVIANNINYMNLDWKVDILKHEKDNDRFINTTVYYKPMTENEVDRLDDRKRKEEIVRGLLRSFGLTHLAKQKGYTLSGGERRRTEIARCLATSPRFLLLDEPFAGIDPKAVYEIKQIVRSLARLGIGILLTDHNVRDALSITTCSHIISEGKILVSGGKRELLANDIARDIYFGESFEEQ